MSESPQHVDEVPSSGHGLKRIKLEEIAAPGAYVRLGTGDLIRVTPESGPEEPTSLPDAAGEPVYVVQISSNPYIPISEARIAAANLDIEIDF